ncbi:hypothetical protein KZC51_07160 [Microbacterium sp. SSW1-49]|uniref:Uncharacterized protein n=1 Tax=Microbacterium croceum TaxID=2851645 RepID=A0ABT0FDR6_9MICO|nr:hypothetical protein [Microbacterium croceum]MCK2035911.1 hypothetical protein [Microbacterium croceum]
MRKGVLSTFARSKRLSFAVVGNGLASLASLALSVAIARSSSVAVFAAFSIAMVAYLFGSGLIRSALTDSALSRPSDRSTYVRSFQRASLVALLSGAALVAWGALAGNAYLVILGITFHGLLSFDFIRTFDSAAGAASRAMASTAIWSMLTMSASVLSILGVLDATAVFVAWAASGALSGYVLMWAARTPLVPKWSRHREDTRVAGLFALDFAVGSGGSLLTTGLLGLLDSARILGAVRGAGTLLGPLNLVSTTVRSLLLPFLSRRSNSSGGQIRAAARVAALQVVFLLPFLVALQLLPATWGRQILGDTWDLASLALLPLSIEAVFALISAVANSGHRVAFAGTRSLALRLSVGLPRPFVVLLCAQFWGVQGAAWSMAAIAAVNALIWWGSYYDLARRTRGAAPVV